MTTELPNTTEAARRDGSPLTGGLGPAPERAAPRMGKEAEQECFKEWITTACPFDDNVGLMENAIQTSAAWAGWLARSALRDWLYAELAEVKAERDKLRDAVATAERERCAGSAQEVQAVAAMLEAMARSVRHGHVWSRIDNEALERAASRLQRVCGPNDQVKAGPTARSAVGPRP